MEQVLDALKKNIESFEDGGKISSNISSTIESTNINKEFGGVSRFAEEVEEIYEELEGTEKAGIKDALKSIQKDLDHVAGQIGVCKRVLKAGAGPHKGAEYIENALESAESSRNSIDQLVEYIEGESSLSEGALIVETDNLERTAEKAKKDIDNLHETLNQVVETLE